MKRLSSRAAAALTNSLLALIVLVIGAVCFLPSVSATSGVNEKVISRGSSENGVSLMFNVYWGTEEVLGILDVLDRFGAKATFFLGGSWADDNVSCVREIASRGHEIASHGYFHREHDKLDLKGNLDEIGASVEFLALVSGKPITLFAPPSGAYSEETVEAAEKLGLKTVLWSRDTVDWRDKDEAVCFSRATEDVKGGELILMHPMKHTLAALPNILETYRRMGLKAITVSENLG